MLHAYSNILLNRCILHSRVCLLVQGAEKADNKYPEEVGHCCMPHISIDARCNNCSKKL